jgi:hypothetical protein
MPAFSDDGDVARDAIAILAALNDGNRADADFLIGNAGARHLRDITLFLAGAVNGLAIIHAQDTGITLTGDDMRAYLGEHLTAALRREA